MNSRSSVSKIEIQRYGGPEVLRLVEAAPVPLGKDQVRVRVAACGVNFADIMMRMGLYPEAPRRPFVPGYEISGTVTETGPEAQGVAVGDRVLAGCRFGGYTSEIVLSAAQVRKIPAGLSETEAAAIPVNFITAWVALQELARVRAGDRVLIQSAAGGVGVAAVQIAAQTGARVVGQVGSRAKFEAVRALGAAEVILNDEGRDRHFDVILDCRGGSELRQSYRQLAPGGRVVHYGVTQMVGGPLRSLPQAVGTLLKTPLFHPLRLMKDTKGVFGVNLLQLFDPSGEGLALMNRAFDRVIAEFEAGRFRVVIGKTFPLAEAGAAHAHLQGRGNVGKVLLLPEGR